MKSFRTTLSLSLVAMVAALAGCGVEAGGAEAETAGQAITAPTTEVAASDTAKENGGPRFGGGRHHGGPDSLLRAALHEDIGLTAEQKTTLEALVPKRPEMKDHPKPDAARGAELAAAIRSGKVDSLQRPEPPKPSDAELAAHKAEMTKNLQVLHDTLTATQRQALVAAVQKHDDQGPGEHGPRDGKGGEGRDFGGPMGGLLKGIELTEAQKTELKTKLEANRPAKPSEAQIAEFKAKHEAMKAEHTAKLQTFASDKFDASAFLTPPAKPEGDAKKPDGRHGDEMAVVVSILTPAQREELAKKIEAGPPARELKK